jgi:hypothetical protein
MRGNKRRDEFQASVLQQLIVRNGVKDFGANQNIARLAEIVAFRHDV